MKIIDTTSHPLDRWLERQGMKAYELAKLCEVSSPTLYSVLNGREPKLRALIAIETATCGEVTLRDCLDWFKRRKELGK